MQEIGKDACTDDGGIGYHDDLALVVNVIMFLALEDMDVFLNMCSPVRELCFPYIHIS